MKHDEDIFADHDSLCSDKQKLIVSHEKGSKHTCENDMENLVRQYKIDGDVISDSNNKKCDYIVINDDKKRAYLIELKGSHVKDAINQLKETQKMVLNSLKGYKFFYRIVFSGKGTHSIIQSDFLKWQKKCGKIGEIWVAQMKRSPMNEKI